MKREKIRATSWNQKRSKYVFLHFHKVALAYATTQHFVLLYETKSACARSHNSGATSWKRFYLTLTQVCDVHYNGKQRFGCYFVKTKNATIVQKLKTLISLIKKVKLSELWNLLEL